MEYKIGETVIVSVFKKLQVGIVIEYVATKSGKRYVVQTEDTKLHESVYVDRTDDETYIVSHITKSYQK